MLGIIKNCYVGYVCTNNVVLQFWRIQGANLAMVSNCILGGLPPLTVNQRGNFGQVTKKFLALRAEYRPTILQSAKNYMVASLACMYILP
jgi:hypothetical protein